MRTTALREALGQLHGQLEELREDHKQLQVGGNLPGRVLA